MRASFLPSNLGVLALISSNVLSDPFSFFLPSGDSGDSVYIGMLDGIHIMEGGVISKLATL